MHLAKGQCVHEAGLLGEHKVCSPGSAAAHLHSSTTSHSVRFLHVARAEGLPCIQLATERRAVAVRCQFAVSPQRR